MLSIIHSGGLETLFNSKKQIKVIIPEGSTIRMLLKVLARDYLSERLELFMKNDTVY